MHLPTVCVFVMTALIFLLCSLGPHLIELTTTESAWYALIILVLALMLAVTYSIIALHEQNTVGLRYKVRSLMKIKNKIFQRSLNSRILFLVL